MTAPFEIWTHPNSANGATHGLTFKLIKVSVRLPLERSLKQTTEENTIYFVNRDID